MKRPLRVVADATDPDDELRGASLAHAIAYVRVRHLRGLERHLRAHPSKAWERELVAVIEQRKAAEAEANDAFLALLRLVEKLGG